MTGAVGGSFTCTGSSALASSAQVVSGAPGEEAAPRRDAPVLVGTQGPRLQVPRVGWRASQSSCPRPRPWCLSLRACACRTGPEVRFWGRRVCARGLQMSSTDMSL